MSNNNEKVSKQELAFYEPMKHWFLEYFQNKNHGLKIEVFDVHKYYLSDFFANARYPFFKTPPLRSCSTFGNTSGQRLQEAFLV